jgi:uncharacterized protein (TIGR00106 family)
MIAEFSIWPIGEGASTSEHVAKVLKLVDESGLPYKLNAMGTVVEGDYDKVMELIGRCHRLLADQMERVVTNIIIDERKGRTDRITKKVESIEKKLGKTLSK